MSSTPETAEGIAENIIRGHARNATTFAELKALIATAIKEAEARGLERAAVVADKAALRHAAANRIAHEDDDDWNAAFHAGGDAGADDIAATIRSLSQDQTKPAE